MLFAWCSLISVGLADFYIRMVASGVIKDLRIL
jgi:TM2 domain-containing membrane protein YozV